MLVVTRAGRLREWSQGELRLYNYRKAIYLTIIARARVGCEVHHK